MRDRLDDLRSNQYLSPTHVEVLVSDELNRLARGIEARIKRQEQMLDESRAQLRACNELIAQKNKVSK